ncbi:MAG: hypothetical protein EOM44_12880, partial [Bacteroidia bacterium]|nr:hypothetical protein [Bacteroidia bacterium]
MNTFNSSNNTETPDLNPPFGGRGGLTLIKVGGKIVENPETLKQLLADFSSIEGYKVLVHGGGRSATALAEQLG